MANPICWFFGCRSGSGDEAFHCQRCGAWMTYEALVGLSRWQAVKDWCEWWMLRRWFPARCVDCGKRYGDHPGCLPF